jgi:hypothetical protein
MTRESLKRTAFDREAFAIEHLDVDVRRQVITAYLDDELSPEAARHVTSWLDESPEALKEVEHLRRVWDLLDLYEEEAVPEGFANRVLAEVDVSGARPRGRWIRFPGLVGALAVAALVLVALGIGMRLGRRPVDPVAPPPVAETPVGDEVPLEYLEEVDVLLALSEDEFDAYLLADLEEPWGDG